ncbi:MAG: D-glycero-beta-D-manno-heptose,7-bisphosphate 7-phosphatase [Rhodospirillales bacterium]|nr:D-glycero-beta-D-manno-heptose,7-bisphosphate 7-phosphatase [Rhodospirillales bacterium]
MMGERRGLILDRDGVINIDINFLHRIEDVVFVEGIFDLVRAAKAAGYAIVVATNQSGIGRDMYSEAQFHTLMDWIGAEFVAQGGGIDAVYFCPHHPTEGQGEYRRDCACRKPKPGMFLQAIAEWDLDPAQSWTIGDNWRDVDAGAAAGVANRVLIDPTGTPVHQDRGHWVAPSMAEIQRMMGL